MKKTNNTFAMVVMLLMLTTTFILGCKKEEITEIKKVKTNSSTMNVLPEDSLDPNDGGGGGSGGGGGGTTTSYVPPGFVITPPYANYQALHRLYNNYTEVHILASPTEALNLVNTLQYHYGPYPMADWVYEGSIGNIFTSQQAGTVALYRYYRGANEDHYYTTVYATPAGYVYEGIQGYVYTSAGMLRTPIHAYSTRSGDADHVYTPNYNELGAGNSHWRYEGVAFYL